MGQLVVVIIVVGLICAVAYVWQKYVRTYHYAVVQEGVLYRDGNRGMTEFATAVRKCNAKTVVMLIDENEFADPLLPQFKQEAEYLKRNGVNLVHLPIRLGGWPSSEDVRKFLDLTNDPKNQPVLVHCAQGVRRTGMFAAAWQESMMKYDNAKANEQVLTFGHSERTVGDLRKFIELYDPATRTIDSASLPISKE